ncbi:diguanylate cyclase [Dongia sp.]|uniref:sensor domain-containing diguanylate cyclase n=1 Tax=Dongia sp. TaxID=1977262 RepID=UPI0035B1336C
MPNTPTHMTDRDPTALEAAARLFAGDGPFTQDRGPMLLLGPDGGVLAANSGAGPLRAAMAAPADELAKALATAKGGTPARLAALELAGADGKPVSFDLTLLPCPGAGGTGILIAGRDISLERALRGALIDSRQRFKELIDAAADFTWEVDGEGAFAFVSGPLAMGYPPADLIGRAPQDFAIAEGAQQAFDGSGPHGGTEIWMRGADRRPICLLVQAQPLSVPGPFRGARGLARDITAQKTRETELADARHRERLVVHLLRSLRRTIDPAEAIATALDTAIQAVGADLGRVLRFGPEGAAEALGGDITPADPTLIQAAQQAPEGVALSQDGGRLGLAFLCRHDGRRVGMLILWRDMARGDWLADDLFLLGELAEQLAVLIEQLKGQERLRHLSTTDALTGLLNRRGFETTLARAVGRSRQAHHGGALLYVDLDNFKQINDRFGHAQGDAALIATADILRNQLRARDPIGRLGGDEFVAWLDEIDRAEAIAKAVALQEAAKSLESFAPGSDRPLGFSIGIAMLRPTDADSLDALMARADEAMYRIKHGGKGSYVVVE